uniref:Small ribosomal subunit protein uS2c n=1 Tax=Rhizochromulina marina TaxID=1034831 RepID=A0A514CPZ3_9STRA|nr:ribosomal protein S2 [Rhizochromulina marina]QDH81872.1 ribosomal protein S2 [Rhizochromulina marina]
MATFSLAQLLEAGVHFGHKADRWNPKMFPYIYAERDGLHILDLVQTAELLNEACLFVSKASQKQKTFLFVGTKPQTSTIVEQAAQACGAHYVNSRWLGGMLTNWETIRTRVDRLKLLERQENEGTFALLPKKEAAKLKKELEKLQRTLGGIREMQNLPDIMIVVDQRHDLTAIREARILNIPIISILDTNCDPDLSDIPIPGNDDSLSSIRLILTALSNSIHVARDENDLLMDKV